MTILRAIKSPYYCTFVGKVSNLFLKMLMTSPYFAVTFLSLIKFSLLMVVFHNVKEQKILYKILLKLSQNISIQCCSMSLKSLKIISNTFSRTVFKQYSKLKIFISKIRTKLNYSLIKVTVKTITTYYLKPINQFSGPRFKIFFYHLA